MAASFFFYDLETSGFDPRAARIMQFAGLRTNLDLEPIDEPISTLIKLTPDVLPDPDAVLVTGTTPQMTLKKGMTEASFLKLFYETIALPDTIFVGFNSIRFDDEFMRFMHYRNFYDAYQWQWSDGRSRWDLLDVVRTTRALRPAGIEWPFAADGTPTNRLEFLTAVNQLDHGKAHDALSDVLAVTAVAKLIKAKQPKLFAFLLSMRDKRRVSALVERHRPFVYCSGSYPSQFEKTTVAVMLASAPNARGALVYDLRYDPKAFARLTSERLAARWQYNPDSDEPSLPVKILHFNRCPAVAPIEVLNAASQQRLQLDPVVIEAHFQTLQQLSGFTPKLLKALALRDHDRQQVALLGDEQQVDGQLYEQFLDDYDADQLELVRQGAPAALAALQGVFHDHRLTTLLPLYKARNFPEALTVAEQRRWAAFCSQRLLNGGTKSRLAKYAERLRQLASLPHMTEQRLLLLKDLQAYGRSVKASAQAA